MSRGDLMIILCLVKYIKVVLYKSFTQNPVLSPFPRPLLGPLFWQKGINISNYKKSGSGNEKPLPF
jgi:hypothetical protein